MSISTEMEAIAGSLPSQFHRGLRDSLPVMIGFVPFALVLGAQATARGLSGLEVPLLTGLNFGGGSEFAAIALWTSPPHLLLIVGVTLLVNSRHLLMGAALAPYLRHLSRRKALTVLFFMCDESWAMSLADVKKRERQCEKRAAFSLGYFMGVSVGLYGTWVVFTAAGAQLGPVLGDITAYGFDMAFPAVFFVLLAGMWKGTRAALPWLVSLIVAVAVDLAFAGAWYVPAGVISGVAVAWFGARS
ncbi:AzlC family ABC transporter permease (plasmid) [Agrobacterium leguminum]|uniref:AzlC family protein n=1 Tax=Agrobacterium deltaense NCPPB 1641 TaxID=1183425 RepID=A0A1S7U8Y0_9HYPH|nr:MULTISPECIES: AzlC family ABC transporter permease [Agrobacterium]WFS70028.1 AzlC family ABC transporter permease [Agrobacterium leguminum]CVI63297.1 AzlC family protein [Agrobacterium deltaense NCPPB 1641]